MYENKAGGNALVNALASILKEDYDDILEVLNYPEQRKKLTVREFDVYLEQATTSFIYDQATMELLRHIRQQIRKEKLNHQEIDKYQEFWDHIAQRIRIEWKNELDRRQLEVLRLAFDVGQSRKRTSHSWDEWAGGE